MSEDKTVVAAKEALRAAGVALVSAEKAALKVRAKQAAASSALWDAQNRAKIATFRKGSIFVCRDRFARVERTTRYSLIPVGGGEIWSNDVLKPTATMARRIIREAKEQIALAEEVLANAKRKEKA